MFRFQIDAAKAYAIKNTYDAISYHCTFPGNPLGFTVARSMSEPERRRVEGWAQDLQVFLAHEWGDECQLLATQDKPVWIATRAYYKNKVHCDPENTHKLTKDVLFRAPWHSGGKNNSDKYTGGFYDDPRIDSENPRLEIWIWNL